MDQPNVTRIAVKWGVILSQITRAFIGSTVLATLVGRLAAVVLRRRPATPAPAR
jgi:hypothetical protein